MTTQRITGIRTGNRITWQYRTRIYAGKVTGESPMNPVLQVYEGEQLLQVQLDGGGEAEVCGGAVRTVGCD